MPTLDSFRCPTCGARQAISPECRRCKCDLSLLELAGRRASQLNDEWLRQIAAGDVHAAELLALRRWELSPDADARRLLSVTYLLQGRFQAALDVGNLPATT